MTNVAVKTMAYALDRLPLKQTVADAIVAEAATMMHMLADIVPENALTPEQVHRIVVEGQDIRRHIEAGTWKRGDSR